MNSVKLFKAGNSEALVVPKELSRRFDLRLGVSLIPIAVKEGILYKIPQKNATLSKDMRSWLNTFEKKHDKALKELSKR